MDELFLNGWITDSNPPLNTPVWIATRVGVRESFYDENGYRLPIEAWNIGEEAVLGWKIRTPESSRLFG